MASDYEGEPSEFALVIAALSFIKKDQISVVDTKTIDHLDAYKAPRLVEYSIPIHASRPASWRWPWAPAYADCSDAACGA